MKDNNRSAASDADEKRASLHFACTAKEKFSFLFELGYVLTASSHTILYYRKKDIQVDVYHERLSYELGVGIALKGKRFELQDFIDIEDCAFSKDYRIPAASNKRGVIICLAKLADLTMRYCKRALQGDSAYFSEIEACHMKNMHAYWEKMTTDPIRLKAYTAFRTRNYQDAVKLYSQIDGLLTPLEKKKLEYAKKKIADEYEVMLKIWELE